MNLSSSCLIFRGEGRGGIFFFFHLLVLHVQQLPQSVSTQNTQKPSSVLLIGSISLNKGKGLDMRKTMG